MPKASPTLTMAKILTTSIPYPREALTPFLTLEPYQKQRIEVSVAMPTEASKVKPQREKDNK